MTIHLKLPGWASIKILFIILYYCLNKRKLYDIVILLLTLKAQPRMFIVYY